jgi:hypothetical protein
MGLERKRGFKLMVVDCPLFLAPKEVFPEETKKPKKTGNRKIDSEEGLE